MKTEFDTLSEAQTTCQNSGDCYGGITQQEGKYQLRAGKIPLASLSGEMSWVKKAANQATTSSQQKGRSLRSLLQRFGAHGNENACLPVKQCGQNEYEASPPTEMSDRVCKPLKVCGQNEYEILSPEISRTKEIVYAKR